jgi:hypothetical protein
MVRSPQAGRSGGLLEQYVNDRPYVASSLLGVAIARVLGGLGGRSKERAADTPLPLQTRIAVLPAAAAGVPPRAVRATGPSSRPSDPLDEQFPAWGPSPYFTVTLSATCRLGELLSHLYVLVPVLDNEKHYFVSDDEVEKLLRHGDGWLSNHPERDHHSPLPPSSAR